MPRASTHTAVFTPKTNDRRDDDLLRRSTRFEEVEKSLHDDQSDDDSSDISTRSGKELTEEESTKEGNVEKKEKRRNTAAESETPSINPKSKPLDKSAMIWDADTATQTNSTSSSSGPTAWVGSAPNVSRPRPPRPEKLIPTNEFERKIRIQRDKKNARDALRKKRRAAEKQKLTYL